LKRTRRSGQAFTTFPAHEFLRVSWMGVDEAWKAACKIVLGGEIGELAEFKDYLCRDTGNSLAIRKSAASGKEISTSASEICAGARVVGNDEAPAYMEGRRAPALSMDAVKDIDSIMDALSESFVYSGNVNLGKCCGLENCDRCINSVHARGSHMLLVANRFIAYSNDLLDCEHCFGLTGAGNSKFVIKGYNTYMAVRCMEALQTYNSSDCHYTANLDGCRNCMFSFNLRNTSNCIGNLALPKDKYDSLKEKLLLEICGELKAKKGITSILDIIGARPFVGRCKPRGAARDAPAHKKADEGFRATARLLFSQEIGPLDDYGGWLARHSGKILRIHSPQSGRRFFCPPMQFYMKIAGNALPLDEALELGKKSISAEDAESLSLKNAAKTLQKIRAATCEDIYGKNLNVSECACYGNCVDSYRAYYAYDAKCAAYCYWPKYSEYLFGCSRAFRSRQCVNCHNSESLVRCFEVEGSNSCSDCYFCHNCEGLQNCMFCFNAKNLRFAIGNREVGQEEYARVKKILLREISAALVRDRELKMDIYNIGCRRA
jgi:hypothetical protein